MQKRVALVGSSSTGKSTVFELLKLKLPKYDFIDESTRFVKSFGFPINEEGVSETQLAISSFHLYALCQPGHLLLDRCYLDVVVYTRFLPNVNERTRRYIEGLWNAGIYNEYSHYIYFPIEFDVVDDGVRSTNEQWRQDVDKEFTKVLKEQNQSYLTVTGSPKARVSQILQYINEPE